MSLQQRLYTWLDERYDLAPLAGFVRHKQVPLGRHWPLWHYLGGTTLLFFGVQILSGLLLLTYYQPGGDTAHESLVYLTTKVPFGWLIRSVHCWSAHLMLLSLCTHMFSAMLLKAYRRPRELTWVSGCVLLGLGLTFGFSGYLLPWNELAYFATSVGTESVKAVPLLGGWLVQVLRGGPDVSSSTLYRFFGLHTCLLPLLTLAVLGVHLLCIQRQGMALSVGETQAPRSMRFFPSFALRDFALWLVCLAGLLTLAVYVPYGPGLPGVDWELGHKANALAAAPPGIKPEWYFLWVYQVLRDTPPHVLGLEGPQASVLFLSVLGAGWVLLPWLDRRAAREQPSPGFSDLGVAVLLELGFLTLKAWDLGGGGAEIPDPAQVAWVCGWWTLVAAALVTAIRAARHGERWFVFTGAVVLQVVLDGLVGLSFLLASLVVVLLLVPALVGLELRARRSRGAAA